MSIRPTLRVGLPVSCTGYRPVTVLIFLNRTQCESDFEPMTLPCGNLHGGAVFMTQHNLRFAVCEK